MVSADNNVTANGANVDLVALGNENEVNKKDNEG